MIRPALASLAAMLAPLPALADTAEEPNGAIIVEGQTAQQVREFLRRAITPVSGRKVARRDAPVCFCLRQHRCRP